MKISCFIELEKSQVTFEPLFPGATKVESNDIKIVSPIAGNTFDKMVGCALVITKKTSKNKIVKVVFIK